MRGAAWNWITGIALAITGVIVARVVAPGREHAIALRLAGDGVALLGLLVIALGIKRKYTSKAP